MARQCFLSVVATIFAVAFLQAPGCRGAAPNASEVSEPLEEEYGEFSWLADAEDYILVLHLKSISYGHTALVGLGESLVRIGAPDGFPWDTVVAMVSDEALMEEAAEEIIMFQIPFLVVTAIFFLLAIFLPIVGFCFCCCRCFGNCGGKRTEEKRSQLKEYYVYIMAPFMVILCAIIGFSTFMAKPIGNRFMETGFDLAYTTLFTAYDLQTFTDNIVTDFEELGYADFDEFSESLLTKVDQVGDDIAGPFVDQSVNYMNDIHGNLETFHQDLEDFVLTDSILSDLNQTIIDLIAETANLDSALSDVADDLTTLTASCLADPALSGAGACSAIPDPTVLDFDLDITQLQDATSSLDPSALLGSFSGTIDDILALLEEANSSISSIPEMIRNETMDLSNTVNSSLVEVRASFRDMINSSTAILGDIDFDELFQVHELEYEIWLMEFHRSEYEALINYQYIGEIILGGGLLIVISLGGLILGALFNESPPGPQSGVADCGGKMSMCAAAWAFVMSFGVCLSAAICFLLGSNLTLICDGLQDLSIIEEVLDNPDMWAGSHPLQGMGLGDNLTFYSLIEECGEDSTIAAIMGLLDSEEIDLDLSEQLPDTGELGLSINTSFSEFDFSDLDPSTLLDGISDQIMPADLPQKIEEIDSLLAGIDIDTIATDLDTEAAGLVATFPSFAGDLTDIATELRRIKSDIMEPITTDTGALTTQLNQLNSTIETLMEGTAPIIANFTSFSDFLANDAFSLIFESLEIYFDDVIGIGQDFIDTSFDKIENEIGRCGVVRLIYDAFVDGICVGFVGAMTLGWMAAGPVSICLVPFICCNVRVAKYHRRPNVRSAYSRYLPSPAPNPSLPPIVVTIPHHVTPPS